MSKIKKGDKYIIEIGEVHTHYDENRKPFELARIKGFNSLVFDKKGLERLEKCKDTEPCEPLLNCQFVCLQNVVLISIGQIMTKGKTYEVKDGFFDDNFGNRFPHKKEGFRTCDELVDYMAHKFHIDNVSIGILKD